MKVSKKLMDEAIPIITKIANDNRNNTFAYYTSEDIKQSVWQMCLDALKRYKKNRGPLENFLRAHVSNRLKNLKRDNYFNHTDEDHVIWSKMNIVNAIPMHSTSTGNNPDFVLGLKDDKNNPYDFAITEELKQYIINRLDEDLVQDFIDLINGNKIRKHILILLQKMIKEILIEYGDKTT